MKKIALIFIIAFTINNLYAQRITKIVMSSTGIVQKITIGLDDAIINITPDGNIVEYGVEYFSQRINNYSRIENYGGRIDMFDNFADVSFRGKLKYLGKTPITYYASYDDESLRGKIKTIGTLMVGYYMPYDDAASRGKLKNVGSTQISYYTSFENEGLRGKISNIGTTSLGYYSSFDDKAYKGKIKNIGQYAFTYYNSFDLRFAGSMKTGNLQQNINGILYFIQ